MPEPHVDPTTLLQAELSNRETVAAGRHLDGCAQCRDDLASTAVGHALLRRSAAMLPEAEPVPVPAFGTGVRPRITRRRPSVPAGWAAAALVLGLGAATLTGWALGRDGSAPDQPVAGPSVAVTTSARLDPVEGGEPDGSGEVRMSTVGDATRMTVTTRDLPPAARGSFYYVWLLDPATNKMLPLGLVDPDGRATFVLDPALVTEYGAVDISLEADDGDPGHSVTSLLRGGYEPA